MQKLKSFIKTSILGGLVVILPVSIVVFVFRWLYFKISDLIEPLTGMLVEQSHLGNFVADWVVIFAIALACFLVGLLVRTSLGKYVHQFLETKLLAFAPGYNLVKETVLQLLGRNKSPFSSVALVNLYGNETLTTAFVTDEHADGTFTVFVPTAPNPTSGLIFHLPRRFVHRVDVGVDETMRSVISCGAGSGKLVAALQGDLGRSTDQEAK